MLPSNITMISQKENREVPEIAKHNYTNWKDLHYYFVIREKPKRKSDIWAGYISTKSYLDRRLRMVVVAWSLDGPWEAYIYSQPNKKSDFDTESNEVAKR